MRSLLGRKDPPSTVNRGKVHESWESSARCTNVKCRSDTGLIELQSLARLCSLCTKEGLQETAKPDQKQTRCPFRKNNDPQSRSGRGPASLWGSDNRPLLEGNGLGWRDSCPVQAFVSGSSLRCEPSVTMKDGRWLEV